MTAVEKVSEGIFRDRRSPSNARAVKPVICRRNSHFAEADNTPWWLRVNYVTSEPGKMWGENNFPSTR